MVHNIGLDRGGLWQLLKRLPSLLASLGNRVCEFPGLRSAPADESGASFWAPGTFANLAAVPGEPGWSFSATYFHAR
jgi:hypothetical protein